MKRLYFARRDVTGTLLDAILARETVGQRTYGLCGGRGACGKCRVRFLSGAPLPSAADRRFFTPDELRAGFRLACTARPAADCEVEICFTKGPEQEILTVSETGMINRAGEGEPGTGVSRFCAVDLGTTTVVMQLVDKITGDILYTYAFENPQRMYGTDVLSRLSAAADGKGELLRTVVMDGLEKGLAEMERRADFGEIVISGNTAMGHLLLGYPTESLGRAPFVPYDIKCRQFLLAGHPAVLLPGISAFVGADIVSGIYACEMAEQEDLCLFLDLGTNGEMALGNREGILCTATAAGSAFEGIVSARMTGTDITALAYAMLQDGVMDETGLLQEPWFTEGYRAGAEQGILISQQDIRELQMAKAAVCAGVSILLDQTDGWGRLSRVFLAGGFGYYLDVEKAAGIGLIPAVLEKRCKAVGNTSLAGAICYGRRGQGMCAGETGRSRLREEALEHIVRISTSLNLAKQPQFAERYVEAMRFGRM